MLSQTRSGQYSSVGESDASPSFITHSYKQESRPFNAILSLKLPILYFAIHWITIIYMWLHLRNSAFLCIVLINMIICAFLIPYRNLKFMEVNRISKYSNFVESINEMIESPPQVYQLFYWNEIISKDNSNGNDNTCDKRQRHHYQELFDQFVWINMSNTKWINDIDIPLTNNSIKYIIIPIELKFSFDKQTKENYEIWKQKCAKKMRKIKKEETLNGKWDGIMFHKHLEMDVFKPLHGIFDGEIRYICYRKESHYVNKLTKNYCCKYLPIYFIMNLIFGALGLTLFTYFKYVHLIVCLLHCSQYIQYDKILMHKKLYNIQRIKRILLLDILENECQTRYDDNGNEDDDVDDGYDIEASSYYGDMINISDEQQTEIEHGINEDIIEKIPTKILDLCIEFTPDCLVPNRIHYDSSSQYYSSSIL